MSFKYLAFIAAALAGNPLVPNVGQADPHIHFWPETNTYYACAWAFLLGGDRLDCAAISPACPPTQTPPTTTPPTTLAST